MRQIDQAGVRIVILDKPVTRRTFLKHTAETALLAGFPAIIPASALGTGRAVAPSNRIALGFIGLGEHGKTVNLTDFCMFPDVQVVALCDVDAAHLRNARLALQMLCAKEEGAKAFEGCFITGDWREVIARDDVDAVVVSTPDHWHVIPAIAAARAGKDIFVEKPLSLTVHEGRVLADTVRQYGRISIVGSENRSQRGFIRACQLVRNGRIGKLHTIRVQLYGSHSVPDMTLSNDEFAPEPVPAGFDYDMWLGQAPEAPYTSRRCHVFFRFIRDYSGGNLSDWGGHFLDVAQWGNNTEYTGPVSVDGQGVFPEKGLYNTAAEWNIEYEYADGVKLICTSGSTFYIRFEGANGWLEADGEHVTASSPDILNSAIGADDVQLKFCRQGEQRDFLDAVKSRCQSYAPVEVGHRAATLAHIGNISMLLGRKLRWDPEHERFLDDDSANAMLSRPMRSPWRLEA